jgi:hypothetical protein
MTNVRRLRFGALAAIGILALAAGYFVLRHTAQNGTSATKPSFSQTSRVPFLISSCR